MSRPVPIVTARHVNEDDGVRTDIITTSHLYVVTYQGKTFNLKKSNNLYEVTPHYQRTTYNNKAHAYRLAAKLNKLYNTDEFNVTEIEF